MFNSWIRRKEETFSGQTKFNWHHKSVTHTQQLLHLFKSFIHIYYFSRNYICAHSSTGCWTLFDCSKYIKCFRKFLGGRWSSVGGIDELRRLEYILSECQITTCAIVNILMTHMYGRGEIKMSITCPIIICYRSNNWKWIRIGCPRKILC